MNFRRTSRRSWKVQRKPVDVRVRFVTKEKISLKIIPFLVDRFRFTVLELKTRRSTRRPTRCDQISFDRRVLLEFTKLRWLSTETETIDPIFSAKQIRRATNRDFFSTDKPERFSSIKRKRFSATAKPKFFFVSFFFQSLWNETANLPEN